MIWQNLLSLVLGATITFAITAYERRQARRDAANARRDILTDARAEAVRRRAETACEAILDAFAERFSLRRTELEDEESYDHADELVRILYHQAIYVPSVELRHLLEETARILDYRENLAGVGIELRTIVYASRRTLHDAIGAWLRDEPDYVVDPRFTAMSEALRKLPNFPGSKHTRSSSPPP